MNIHELDYAFRKLASTSGINSKKDLLKEYLKDNDFKNVLVFLLNPYITTGIGRKSINKCVWGVQKTKTLNETLEYISKNNTGTNSAVETVCGFIEMFPDNREFLEKLFTKTLKCGVDAKTVNSVEPNLVPTFNIQLGTKYFGNENKINGSFTLTEKLDGFRLIAIAHDNKIEFYSRQGKLVEGLVEIEPELRSICEKNKIKNAVFDGELVAINCKNISSDENYKIVTTTSRKNGVKTGLKYMIFDVLKYEDFVKQICNTEYWERRNVLKNVFRGNCLEHIELLPVLYNGNDKEMIIECLNRVRKLHKEGIMINLDNGAYEFKRTTNLLKVKVMQDADLKIVDIYEGTGKNENKLGGIVVEFIYENNTYYCECGSGFSDDERIEYWNHPEKIINKIATIQYFEISKNENGGYGLRFPVWVHRIRTDKKEVSMN